MSHHFAAKGGTHFNFNSDLIGVVSIRAREPEEGETHVRAADLLEFVDWWRREYEQKASEAGTLEDRVAELEEAVSLIRGHLVL